MLLRTAVAEFLLDRESLGRKPNTLTFYRSQLSRFADHLETCGYVDVSAIDRSSVRDFFAHLNRREVKPGTAAAYDHALRTFCRFCVAEGWLDKDPMKTRPRMKPPRTLPDTWTLSEIAELLATCDDSPTGIRDRAAMLLLLDTGLRAGELVSLTPDDMEIGTDRGRVLVQAEGSKSDHDRIVPFWSETAETLRRWFWHRPPEAETVFVAATGHRHLKVDPLTEGGLYQMMRRRVSQAGIERKARLCHIWRHTFAKNYVLAGGDLETLRRLLGHTTLDTVRIYLGFKTDDLEALHFERSPVRRLYELTKVPR